MNENEARRSREGKDENKREFGQAIKKSVRKGRRQCMGLKKIKKKKRNGKW